MHIPAKGRLSAQQKQWIREKYLEEKLLPGEIAGLADCDAETIESRLRRMRLWERPRIEADKKEHVCDDPEKVEGFLFWFRQISPCRRLSYIEQRGNQIIYHMSGATVYSNGRRVPFKRTMELHAYYDYIKSYIWERKSKRIRESRGYKCEMCGSSNGIHCHHLTYDHLGNEPDEDLMVVCPTCHKRIHRK